MGPGDVIVAVVVAGAFIGVLVTIGTSFQRWVGYKQRKAELEAEARRAVVVERGDYSEMLEDRVRVLERIATDRGLDLAHEIETLRDEPVLAVLPNEELN